MSMLEAEQESWRLLLEEAEREGEFTMESNIRGLQSEAEQAYSRLPSSDAAPYLQAVMQAEIALQLSQANEYAEKRIEQADTQNALLLRIALAVEALNPGR
jgi:hypothetical protein